MLVVVMGVAGSGKSTVGRLVAEALEVPFLDADDFHDDASIEGMRRGIPLDDAARIPWLDRLHGVLHDHREQGAVMACSALTVAYRTRLAHGLDVAFAMLEVPIEVLADRLERRRDHFAGPQLLASQLATLELGPNVEVIDGDRPPAEVAADIVARAGRSGT
jgi:carbohydrate kinase (thermoresistant glucokinase family)